MFSCPHRRDSRDYYRGSYSRHRGGQSYYRHRSRLVCVCSGVILQCLLKFLTEPQTGRETDGGDDHILAAEVPHQNDHHPGDYSGTSDKGHSE